MNKITRIEWVVGWAIYAVACAAIQAKEMESSPDADALRVAIRPFEWRDAGKPPIDLTRIVAEDLRRSGAITPIVARTLVVPDPKTGEISLEFDKWRQQGVDYLVTGHLYRTDKDEANSEKYAARFQVYEVKSEEKREEWTLEGDANALRRLAHGISNDVFFALIGERGVFNTRIAYVAKRRDKKGRERFSLEIADADGENPHSVVVSDAPLRAPAWSPDGEFVSYITLESGTPQLFSQRLTTGARERLSASAKINSAPEWSPDGQRVMFSTAEKEKSCIYLLDVRTKGLRCVINRSAPLADPSWMPDGKSAIYTLMDGTTPQLRHYFFNSSEDTPLASTRISGFGAVFAPEGSSIAYVRHTPSRQQQLVINDLDSGAERILHTAARIGKPSFAPNGRQLIVAVSGIATGHSHSALWVISSDGRATAKISSQTADFADPAWAPLPR